MAEHVFARVAGHGWVLLPLAPFRWVQRPDELDPTVEATHFPDDGDERTVRIRIRQNDVHWEAVTPGIPLDSVLDVYETQLGGIGWAIETAVFRCTWPQDYTLQSSSVPFDLVGPNEELIWIQGPVPAEQVAPPAQMLDPGQTLISVEEWPGKAEVEVAYTHEGVRWRKFYHVLDLGDQPYKIIVSAQAEERFAEGLRAASRLVFQTLEPIEGDFPVNDEGD